MLVLTLAAEDAIEQPAVPRPAWASAHGRDQYGTWADLTVGKQIQRFRYILPGTFTMGSPITDAGRRADEVEHPVTLTRPFWLGDSEVTQAMWVAVTAGANPSQYADRHSGPHPVNQVSWIDCRQFLDRLNQLVPNLHATFPTEAQWEYACRAGTTGQRYGEMTAIAWCREESGGWNGNPVRKRAPNAWGLYDMIGNVWEWCADWSADYATGPVSDPVGGRSGTARIVRGGGTNNDPQAYRAAFRLRYPPDFRFFDIGFRLCVPTLPGKDDSLRGGTGDLTVSNAEFLEESFQYMHNEKDERQFFLGKKSQKWFGERLTVYHPEYQRIIAEFKRLLKETHPSLDLMYEAKGPPSHVSPSDTSTLYLKFYRNGELTLAQAALRIATALAPGRLVVHGNSEGSSSETRTVSISYSAWFPWHPPITAEWVQRLLTEPKTVAEFHALLASQPLLPEVEKEVHPPPQPPGLVMRFDLARSLSDFDQKGYFFSLDKAASTPAGVFVNGAYAAWVNEPKLGDPMHPYVDCPDLDPLRFTVSALLAPSGQNPMRGSGDSALLFSIGAGESLGLGGTWIWAGFDVSRRRTRNALVVGFNSEDFSPLFPHDEKPAMAKIIGSSRWYAVTLAVDLRGAQKTITVHLNGLKSQPIVLPQDALPWVVRRGWTSRSKRFQLTDWSSAGNFRGVLAAVAIHNGILPDDQILAMHAKWDAKKRVLPDHPDFGDRRGQPVAAGSLLMAPKAEQKKPGKPSIAAPVPDKPAPPPKANLDDF